MSWDQLREHVSVPVDRRPKAIRTHVRSLAEQETAVRDGIPVTSIALTLIDLATKLGDDRLDRAVNEADRLDLIDPGSLGTAITTLRFTHAQVAHDPGYVRATLSRTAGRTSAP